MKKTTLAIAILVSLHGCTTGPEKTDMQASSNWYQSILNQQEQINAGIASISALDQPIVNRTLILGLIDSATIQSAYVKDMAQKMIMTDDKKEYAKFIAERDRRKVKAYFDAIAKSGIYSNVQIIETQGQDLIPEGNSDVIFHKIAGFNSELYSESEKLSKRQLNVDLKADLESNFAVAALQDLTVFALQQWNTAAPSQERKASGKQYGKGHIKIKGPSDLPPGQAKKRLTELSPKAKERAISWLNNHQFPEADFKNNIDFDSDGGVFYIDQFEEADIVTDSGTEYTFSEALPLDQTFKLHSKPDSKNRFYIDVNGGTLENTIWNIYSGIKTFNTLPFDIDGNPNSFSDNELLAIQEIWSRISEDYSPFDIDITTEKPSSFTDTTGTIMITKSRDANGVAMPSSRAGGVAYIGVFGIGGYGTTYSPALVYYNNLSSKITSISEAASHEAGHNLGLSHDGNSSTSYYRGLGTGLVSWAPIMGTAYNKNVTQWSNGSYPDANNTQDDIGIIAGKVGTRKDDHTGLPTQMIIDVFGNIYVTTPETDDPSAPNLANKGVISQVGDIDTFSFSASAGPVNLIIKNASAGFYNASHVGANLDIQASLYDSNGNLVITSDPLDDTNAVITTDLKKAGTYLLAITGVGNQVTPYPDYGSLGQYFISGTITPPGAPVPEPEPLVTSDPVPTTDPASTIDPEPTTETVTAATEVPLSNPTTLTQDDTTLSIPGNFFINHNSDGTVTLNWNAVSSAMAYEIQREKYLSFRGVWKDHGLVGVTSDNTLTDDVSSGTFHYKVRALSSSTESDWTDWVEVIVQ